MTGARFREALRLSKRKRVEPPPRNAFPDVVEKGLVSDEEARQLFDMYVERGIILLQLSSLADAPFLGNSFFSGSHLFVTLFDKGGYDTYESIRERTPFSACSRAIIPFFSPARLIQSIASLA